MGIAKKVFLYVAIVTIERLHHYTTFPWNHPPKCAYCQSVAFEGAIFESLLLMFVVDAITYGAIDHLVEHVLLRHW